MAEILLAEGSAPSTPSTGRISLYAKTDSLVYFKDDTGLERTFGYASRIIAILVTDPNGADIAIGDGQAYFRVNSILNGYKLTSVAAHVTTVSSLNKPSVQIHNVTTALDILSTLLSIDANEKDSSTASVPAVINTSNNTVSTGDELRIDIDIAGTGAKGLQVDLTFTLT